VTREGINLPPDLIEIIVFEYLLPEFWVVPWTLQQDICLLKGNTIYSMPPSIGVCGFHGEWNIVEGQGMRVSTMPEFSVKALNDSHHRFKTSWSSQEASSVYGQGHEEILKKFTDQGNWCKVKILNYMRSVECPVLYTQNTYDRDEPDYMELREPTEEDVREMALNRSPAAACGRNMDQIRLDENPCCVWQNTYDGDGPDYMELRELTEKDVRERGVGSFEATRNMDQIRLEEVLDEIIHYSVEEGPAGCGMIWHPAINGNGNITFTTR